MAQVKNGFTLVEIMVTVSIIGVISVGIVNMFLSTLQSRDQVRLQADIQTQGDNIATTIERNLRFANRYSCDAPNKKITYRKTGETADSTYEFVSSNVKVNGGSDLINSSLITISSSSISCTPASPGQPGLITIKYKLRATTPSGKALEQDFEIKVSMRNLK